MDPSGTLLTIAEIAVAFAGFAALVSVLGRRQDSETRSLDALRLQLMLEVTLEVALFALLPLPFIGVISEPEIWRIASGLRLIGLLGSIAYSMHRARLQPRAFEQRWLTVSTLSLAALGLLVNLANVFGLGGSHAFSLFLASMVAGLTSSGLLFLAVAGSVLGAQRQ
jgi:hypothetical protein